MKQIIVDFSEMDVPTFRVPSDHLQTSATTRITELTDKRNKLLDKIQEALPREKKKIVEPDLVVLMLSIADKKNNKAEVVYLRELLQETLKLQKDITTLSLQAKNLTVASNIYYKIGTDKLEYWGL